MNIPLGFDAVAGTLMEEGAKKRLIGAAVVIALLVIFVPMFLEEKSSPPVSEEEMRIPPRPDFEQDDQAPVWEDPVEPTGSGFREYEEPLREEATRRRELPPPRLLDAPATTEPEIVPEPALNDAPPAPERTPVRERETPPVAKPRPKPAPERKRSPAAPPPKPACVRPAAPRQPAAAPTSWIIQVASVRERERAYSLVQELRAKGFPAYMSEARVKGRLWYRVRVGPESGRAHIESMAAKLRRKTGRQIQIQRYP